MDLQEQLDDQRERETENTETVVADTPLLTDAAIRKDARKTDIVEVNFSDQTARVVESSDAPKLTLDVVKAKAAPVQPAKVIFDGKKWHARVRMGVPFSLNVKHAQLAEKHKGATETAEQLKALDRAVKNLYIAEMIESPSFSFEGEGDGTPIEECSDILVNALWGAFCEKNTPIDDQIYQVKSLRGQPIHTAILLGESLNAYPAQLDKKITDYTPADIEQATQRSLAQRRILVSSMIFPSLFTFSFNGEGSGDVTYPVEDISEQFLQTLHTAYRVSNIPSAALDMVHRFPALGENGEREGVGT